MFIIEGILKCLFLVFTIITLPIAKLKFIQIFIGISASILGLKR
jgi:hypothetical protein